MFYRCTPGAAPGEYHWPQRFVRGLIDFAVIADHVDPIAATVQLTLNRFNAGRPDPGLPSKCMVELAYERVRLTVAQDAPSRLEAVFALTSLDTATAYVHDNRNPCNFVFECEPLPGAAVRIADMSLFYSAWSDIDVTEEKFRERWHAAARLAEEYWTRPVEEAQTPEALVYGVLKMDGTAIYSSVS